MFVIVVDYYMVDPEEKLDYITVPHYLGIENPPYNVYVFDENIVERTKKFNTRNEAEEYINAHKNLKNSCSFENIRVEER